MMSLQSENYVCRYKATPGCQARGGLTPPSGGFVILVDGRWAFVCDECVVAKFGGTERGEGDA